MWMGKVRSRAVRGRDSLACWRPDRRTGRCALRVAKKPDLLRSLSGAASMQASDKREQAVQLRRLAEEARRPHDRAYLKRLAQSRDREAQELEVREASDTSGALAG